MTGTFARHRLDISALVWGITFVAVGLVCLAAELNWLELSGPRPAGVTLLSIGIAGVCGMIAAGVRSQTRQGPTVE